MDDLDHQWKQIVGKYEELVHNQLFQGKYDNCNCMVTLQAGAGGLDAQDWTDMIYNMIRVGNRT